MIKKLTGRPCDISVGVLTANLMNLEQDLLSIEKAGVKILHFDVMDGNFCPLLTFGPPFIKSVETSMLKDVHLMIENPLDYLQSYANAGADILTVHLESTRHIHQVFHTLSNMKRVNAPDQNIIKGVALNPGTPLESLYPVLDQVDMVSLLAVNPGWGGQKLSTMVLEKLKTLKAVIKERGLNVSVTLDGGVTKDNIKMVAKAGADLIVTGSAVFDKKDPAGNATFMLAEIAERVS